MDECPTYDRLFTEFCNAWSCEHREQLGTTVEWRMGNARLEAAPLQRCMKAFWATNTRPDGTDYTPQERRTSQMYHTSGVFTLKSCSIGDIQFKAPKAAAAAHKPGTWVMATFHY